MRDLSAIVKANEGRLEPARYTPTNMKGERLPVAKLVPGTSPAIDKRDTPIENWYDATTAFQGYV